MGVGERGSVFSPFIFSQTERSFLFKSEWCFLFKREGFGCGWTFIFEGIPFFDGIWLLKGRGAVKWCEGREGV